MRGPALSLKEHLDRLLKEHGDSYRALSKVTKVSHIHLWRMHQGERIHPSERTLRRLGLSLVPVIPTYTAIRRSDD